jgi:methionyl-tRNA formyltransferase
MDRILVFGDSWGIPQLIRHLPPERISAIVAAEIRVQYHAELKALADSLRVPFLVQPRKGSDDYSAFVERVRTLAPDLIVVNSYSMLLQPEILLIPRVGCINVHSALLPKYRGSNPLQWPIINNETETGVTMHYMTAEFDTGDIIAQRRVPIHFRDTWLDLQTRCAAATDDMLEQEMAKILSQTNDRRPQDEKWATRSRRRRPDDGLIDWHQQVISIHNLIRALVKPLPGAFYYSGAKKVTLDQYVFVPEVVALKYAADVGGQKLRSEKVELLPLTLNELALAGDRQRNDRVVFNVHSRESSTPIGSCWLDNIDYAQHSAGLNIRMNSEPRLEKEAEALLVSFAFDELSLERLSPARVVS